MLKDAQILVTRPQHQASSLCELIEQQGGVAVRFPTLEIKALAYDNEIARKLAALNSLHWLFFMSANAVNFAVQANNGRIGCLTRCKTVAIGNATAKAMRQQGIKIDLIPASGFTSEALLAMPDLQFMQDKRCLIVRGRGGRDKLAQVLCSRGAQVEYLETYIRKMPDIGTELLTGKLERKQLAAVTITSGESLQNLLTMLDDKIHPLLFSVPLVVISHRIKQLADKLGFKRIAVTEKPADSAIIITLTTLIDGENSGRSK